MSFEFFKGLVAFLATPILLSLFGSPFFEKPSLVHSGPFFGDLEAKFAIVEVENQKLQSLKLILSQKKQQNWLRNEVRIFF